jgi:hypothetical protein
MEVWLTILGGMFGIAGAFAGVWLANHYERRMQREKEKRDTTMSLYVEFQSPEMLQARIIARHVFARNLKKKKPLTISILGEKLDKDEWHSVSVVITFFEKLGVFLKNDYLDKKLARNLFKYDFNWWYSTYMEKFVKSDDKLKAAWSQSIEYVQIWFNSEQH